MISRLFSPSLETASPQETLQRYIGFVRQQFLVIALVTLLGVVLGVVYLITTPPSYTAKAKLIIDSRKFNLLPVQQQAVWGDFPLDTAAVDSQVEVLKSENVAVSVIKNLHLMQNPEFIAPSGGLMGAIVGFISNPIGPIAGFISNPAGSSEPTSEFELMRQAVGALQGWTERQPRRIQLCDRDCISVGPTRACRTDRQWDCGRVHLGSNGRQVPGHATGELLAAGPHPGIARPSLGGRAGGRQIQDAKQYRHHGRRREGREADK